MTASNPTTRPSTGDDPMPIAEAVAREVSRLLRKHPPLPRLAYSVAEAAAVLGIGRTLAYRLVGEGKLRTRGEGGRRLVTHEALVEYLDSLEERGL